MATLTKLQTQMNENKKRLSNITHEKGVSNWLKTYPISYQWYYLNNYQITFTLWLEINEHSINMWLRI